jgi:hypothetical protein
MSKPHKYPQPGDLIVFAKPDVVSIVYGLGKIALLVYKGQKTSKVHKAPIALIDGELCSIILSEWDKIET